MSQENQRSSELNHAEKVGDLGVPSVRRYGGSSSGRQKQPLDFPTPAVAAQWPSILSSLSPAIGHNQFDAVFLALPFIQPIAIVGTVCDQPFRQSTDMALIE